ncbi:MAG: hypothetical protein H0V27_02390 [Pyrinomonadaceae bacterium]|nr:hypothetical protein [Pyrinomonadaceae bacterium]
MNTKVSKSKKKRGSKVTLFDSIRKPLAPPGHPLGQAKPDSFVHPTERKTKHKGKLTKADRDAE